MVAAPVGRRSVNSSLWGAVVRLRIMAGERYAFNHHRLRRLLRSITSPSAMQGNA